VTLPRGDQYLTGKVIRRKRDSDGNLIGRANTNPLLLEFEDGHVESSIANFISENMFEQVDNEGFVQIIMDEIVDHRKTGDTVLADDSQEETGRPSQATKVWSLCIRWKDGSTTWEKLVTMK
jgi:hypothetical protein